MDNVDNVDDVTCCQINLRKSNVAATEINKRSESIVLVTEPPVAGGKTKSLKQPNAQIFSHEGKESPRSAIRVAKGLHPWLVPEYTERDICVVAIQIKSKLVYLCSLYLDITFDIRHQLFCKLVDRCNQERIPLVVGMDSNAHSPLWGSPDRNERGEELEEILLSKNLTVMNVGSRNTFVSSVGSSVIDITVMNCAALEHLNLSTWVVSTEASHSDHRYILYSLGKYKPAEEMFRNLKKANWARFAEALDTSPLVEIARDGSNINECADALENNILRALDAACPLKKATDRPPNPWWNQELDEVRKELAVLHKNRMNSPEDWAAYTNLRKIYANKIRKAKRASWRDFCTRAETAKDISKVVKILKPKPKAGISLFKNQGKILSPKETLENLMNVHFIESVEPDEEREAMATNISLNTDDGTQKFVDYIDVQKVVASLHSFGPFKAAGPDGFKPLVLQNLTAGLYEYVTELYKAVVLFGQAPKAWRAMKVIFLPKAGKDDYGKAKSYRPITLSNFLLKGLERLIQWFINDEVIKDPLYAQHAYTVGKSCDTAVSDVLDFLEKNVYRGNHVLAVSLDCSGAFDRIKFQSAKAAMERKKIPKGIIDFYLNILHNRTVTAALQGEKCNRKPMRGSPQGGVLSPLIWILIMDTILSKFRGRAVKVVCYADDIILLIGGKDPGTLVDVMNEALKKVLNWGEENGLIFNPEKTCTVRFSRCKKFSTWRKVKLNGTELTFEDSMKYLGVTLQRGLTWSLHVHERVSKSTKVMNLANAAIGQKWGFNPERALWVYTALARSVSTYGAIAWSQYITGTISNKLSRLQRKALLSMTSSMRSTPTAGMEVVLGLIPLDLHTQKMGLNARLRTRYITPDTWDGVGKNINGHRLRHDKILEGICPKKLPIDYLTRRRDWIRSDKVEEPNLTLYTDGSKMNCGTGAGWAVCHNDTVIAEDSFPLGHVASVFQAEVIAIEQGLRWINLNCPDSLNIIVRSDSQAAINAILSTTTDSKLVWECKRTMHRVQTKHNIALKWIKGHADFTGNELADYLARQGSSMECHSVYPDIPVPIQEIKQSIAKHVELEWQKQYSGLGNVQKTKVFFPNVDGKKLKKLAKESKQRLNLLVQVGTGHALVANHLSHWIKIKDECALCEEGYESTEHLYFQCPRLELDRRGLAHCAITLEQKLITFFSMNTLEQLFQERSRMCKT